LSQNKNNDEYGGVDESDSDDETASQSSETVKALYDKAAKSQKRKKWL